MHHSDTNSNQGFNCISTTFFPKRVDQWQDGLTRFFMFSTKLTTGKKGLDIQ